MVAEPLALNEIDPRGPLPTSAVSVEKLTKIYKGSGKSPAQGSAEGDRP